MIDQVTEEHNWDITINLVAKDMKYTPKNKGLKYTANSSNTFAKHLAKNPVFTIVFGRCPTNRNIPTR